MAGAPYAVWYYIQTSVTIIYGEEYGYNDLVVGLCYLSGGAGVIVGGFVAGKLMDWNYTYTAKKAGLSVDRVAGDNILQFPINFTIFHRRKMHCCSSNVQCTFSRYVSEDAWDSSSLEQHHKMRHLRCSSCYPSAFN
jgi:hypothetical protein